MKNEELRDSAISSLKDYIDSLDQSKGRKLSYWVRDYVNFLKKERTFDPKYLIRYKRGSIVNAHLGYRVGNEEGGLHYAVVVDEDNTLGNGTLTIVPLTSVKPKTDLSKLHRSKLFLGNEIYTALTEKVTANIKRTQEQQSEIQKRVPLLQDEILQDTKLKQNSDVHKAELECMVCKLRECRDIIKQSENIIAELDKMKAGSIALVGQITTISKIRIYDPLHPFDTLNGIRLSNGSLDRLDAKIIELFTKK